MSTLSRRTTLLVMAILVVVGPTLYAFQTSKAKPATVTLVITGMT